MPPGTLECACGDAPLLHASVAGEVWGGFCASCERTPVSVQALAQRKAAPQNGGLRTSDELCVQEASLAIVDVRLASMRGSLQPRLSAAAGALLFPQQEAAIRAQRSAELRLLVINSDGTGAP